MRWGRLATGLALAVVSGLVLGGTGAVADGLQWWAGGLTLLAGVLFTLSALQCHQEAVLALPRARPREVPQAQSPTPLLGEMLVSQEISTLGNPINIIEIARGRDLDIRILAPPAGEEPRRQVRPPRPAKQDADVS